MDRKPEHIEEDSNLRKDFISQVSWDEWAQVNAPFLLIPNARELVEEGLRKQGLDAIFEDVEGVAIEQWQKTLNPETRLAETLYLQGLTYVQRKHVVEQQHALFVRRAVELGLIEERQKDQEFRQQFGD